MFFCDQKAKKSSRDEVDAQIEAFVKKSSRSSFTVAKTESEIKKRIFVIKKTKKSSRDEVEAQLKHS